ncbi:unnamed protein product [Zymoseptoria tritici ST99CH_1A5]|uniref:RTA1 like protein n=1 Tax=Zymoseptoria tritici ST99CH_1A5 TaxID=1276529 RepID=A0A1Y6LLN9_ZYMTR|nr:unnamed protein product [Zymoseptoria tritici ST99CH_1A5]
MLHARQDDGGLSEFEFYKYQPSLVAAIICVVAFFIITTIHIYQMFRTRTWFMIAFCIGGIFETVGYVGRAASAAQDADAYTLGPYIIQSILLLVAPALFAASIYMELARIVLLVDGDHALFIRRRWLTRIFVSGDVLSFLVQASGGGLLAASSDSVRTGENLILVGLALQIIIFGFFVIAGAIFHFRIRKAPTLKGQSLPYQKHMWSLYGVSILIFIRSIVRLIEYAQGYSGYILSREWYLYVFDALLMFAAMAIMSYIHPSEVKALIRGGGKAARNFIFFREVKEGGQVQMMQTV